MTRLLVLIAILAASPALAQESRIPPLPVKQFTAEQRQIVADYVAQHRAFRRAYVLHRRKTDAYWDRIAAKRSARRSKLVRGQPMSRADYVMEQPPAYAGPPEPELPAFLPEAAKPRTPKRTRPQLPVVRDFLRYAARYYGFVPQRPRSEMEYKRAYARTALKSGISKDQAVRIYGFEASGNGKYDVQAGLESGRKGRPISTALGYNQLLVANTIGLVSKFGGRFIEKLERRAATAQGDRRRALTEKITGLRRMVRYARSMPYRWSHHVRASRTSRGRGLHALILDVDIGPLLQTQKLVNSIKYARRLGYEKRLTAAELEMLNLTGDGNGFDMISLSPEMRQVVPTANFFQQNGYERNPVASRNATVASLLSATNRKMDYHAALDGGKQMARAFDEMLREARLNAQIPLPAQADRSL